MRLIVSGTGCPEALLAPLAQAWGGQLVSHPALLAVVAKANETVEVFAWSSGVFAALRAASAYPLTVRRLFAYEPPFGMNRDSGAAQRRAFARLVGWSLVGIHRRARRAFWQMVSLRRDGSHGFEQLPPALQAQLLSVRGPLLSELFGATTVATHGLEALDLRLAVGDSSTAAMRRAVQRLRQAVCSAPSQGVVVDSPRAIESFDGLDHLAPLAAPRRIADWLCAG